MKSERAVVGLIGTKIYAEDTKTIARQFFFMKRVMINLGTTLLVLVLFSYTPPQSSQLGKLTKL
jgi:hypothetical protein